MNNWFECKVRYEKTTEDGSLKKVSDTYLIDALSFTEAEARFTQVFTPFISGEYLITDIKRMKLSDVLNSDGGSWYKGKLTYITIDEKSGKEKKTNNTVLLEASDISDAKAKFDKYISQSLGEVGLTSISETDILDVVRYEA